MIADCGCQIDKLKNQPSLGKSVRIDGEPVMDVVVKKCPSCNAYTRQREACIPDALKAVACVNHKHDPERWNRIFMKAMNMIWEERYGKIHS